MTKTGVLVVGPSAFWQRICPVLAGAGHRPAYGGDGTGPIDRPRGPVHVGVVGQQGSAPAVAPQSLRTAVGDGSLPVLFMPSEAPPPQTFERYGFDDVAGPNAGSAEIRRRLRRLLEFETLRAEVRERADSVRRLEVELERLHRALEPLSGGGPGRSDPLTGLLGSPAFWEEAGRRCAQPGPVSFLVLNLDHFKALNDRYGHVAGDQVLREAARRVLSVLPAEAAVGRISGDGFAVVTAGGTRQAIDLAEGIRVAIAHGNFDLTGASVPITASVGATTCHGGTDPETLFAAADNALYGAKAAGRNRALHSEDLEREALEGQGSPEVHAFEALTQVMTERVGQVLAGRGRRLLDQARLDAEIDPLTGLYNRRYLDRRLPVECRTSQEACAPLTVALMDIDFFGQVNKTHGWPTGDRVLREVSSRIRRAVRTTDWVARYGGEEIVIVMPGAPVREAFSVAERVRLAIETEPFVSVSGRTLSVTASIGLAEAAAETPFERVFEEASRQLLDAKRQGRNRVRPLLASQG